MAVAIRLAGREDLAFLRALMARAIGELQSSFLTPEQIVASADVMGLDTQLIADGTYFVAEIDGRAAGCGGWSRRATLFGGDHSAPLRDPRLLDPAREPARVRAMYTDPDFVRRGVGRAILAHCEGEARAAGFGNAEMMATLAGEPLYRACGYRPIEPVSVVTASGVAVPMMRMGKALL